MRRRLSHNHYLSVCLVTAFVKVASRLVYKKTVVTERITMHPHICTVHFLCGCDVALFRLMVTTVHFLEQLHFNQYFDELPHLLRGFAFVGNEHV